MKKVLSVIFLVVFSFQIVKADPTYEGLGFILCTLFLIIWAIFYIPLTYYLYFKKKNNDDLGWCYFLIWVQFSSLATYLYFLLAIEEKYLKEGMAVSLMSFLTTLPIYFLTLKRLFRWFKLKKDQEKNYLEKPTP